MIKYKFAYNVTRIFIRKTHEILLFKLPIDVLDVVKH